MKILYQMTDLLRKNNKANIDLCAITSLALLTLEKLSNDNKIDKNTQDMNTRVDGEFIRDIMQHVANNKDYEKNISDAYKLFIEEYFVKVQNGISDIHLNEASVLAREFIKTGLLSKQSIKDDLVLWINSYANYRAGDFFIPKEISELLIGLVDIHKDDDVCIEWDSGAQLGIRASEITSKVVIENPLRSCMPLFIDILFESNISFEFCDPIINPSRVSDGKLHRYDVTLSNPPFGLKGDIYKNAVDSDWFNRFPEKTNQGVILAIHHLLSITKRIGVIAVQDSILFSPGAGHKLRKHLINKGVVNSVISMPQFLLPHTNIGFSILVITPSRKNSFVRFIDLRHMDFHAVKNGHLTFYDLEKILSLVFDNSKSKSKKDIETAEVESNNYNLHPSKYVLDPAVQHVYDFLQNENTDKLGNHIDIISPRPHRKGVDKGLSVFEIGAADIPDRGCIKDPSKFSFLDEDLPGSSFAKYKDIILIAKGSVGKVGIVPSHAPAPAPGEIGWIVGQSAIILRVNSDKVDPNSLLIYLRSYIGQLLLGSITSGSTIPFIKISDLKELPIIIPDDKTKSKMTELLDMENEISQQIKTLSQDQAALTKDIWSLESVNT